MWRVIVGWWGQPLRALEKQGQTNIVVRTSAELDLTNQRAVRAFFVAEQPDQVYLAAGKVGGIHANNTYPAAFIYENLMIQANVIHEAWQVGVKRVSRPMESNVKLNRN